MMKIIQFLVLSHYFFGPFGKTDTLRVKYSIEITSVQVGCVAFSDAGKTSTHRRGAPHTLPITTPFTNVGY